MSPETEEDDGDVWGQLSNTIASSKDEEDDEPPINVVSQGGLASEGAAAASGELPYVGLLKAAVAAVQTGDITMEQYIEGVKKLDAIADNALRVYSIPAVKNDLPGKLTEHQNSIVTGLEAQIHKMKEGLGILLSYPETQAVGDLEVGLKTAVDAMNAIAGVQTKADAEAARIAEEAKADRARRAQKAAEAEDDDE